MSDEKVSLPPSKEVAAGNKETIDAAENRGNCIEPKTFDAGKDSGTGRFIGDGADVKFVRDKQ